MANVFISHAGADTGLAEHVHRWLEEDGHHAFLDRDINDGVLPGEEWEERLYRELRKADAVVCIVTQAYLTSVWCAAEIGAARGLGSELLPMRFSADCQRHTLLKAINDVDALRDSAGARESLRVKLAIIDGTGGRGWPDDRSPYPGLRAFNRNEHQVFFGRHAEITQIAEQLRSPERSAPAILTVVGPSGCGKSSLIRAGLLPRIAAEKYWVATPPIVPGIDPLDGLLRAIAETIWERHIPFDTRWLRHNLYHYGLKAVATDLLMAARADSQCKLLIVIDQFEELLTQTPVAQRAAFAAQLGPALGGPVQALATLRPEFLDPLAKDPHLSRLPPRIHVIRPLDSDALRSVIEQPAKVAGLKFEADLVTRLVTDTPTGDALPLLAFTLEQLAQGAPRKTQLSHQRYAQIGGVRGALQGQAEAALRHACSRTGVTPDRVISELLNRLVTIDEEGKPTKRPGQIDDSVRELFEPFVANRLLSTDGASVSVAHEAFLMNWPPLKHEIEAKATSLRAGRMVESEAADWEDADRDAALLLKGPKLTKAIDDTGAELSNRWFGLPASSSGRHRLVTLVDLTDTGHEFLEKSMRADRSHRGRERRESIRNGFFGGFFGLVGLMLLVGGLLKYGFPSWDEVKNWELWPRLLALWPLLLIGAVLSAIIAATSAGVGFIQDRHRPRRKNRRHPPAEGADRVLRDPPAR